MLLVNPTMRELFMGVLCVSWIQVLIMKMAVSVNISFFSSGRTITFSKKQVFEHSSLKIYILTWWVPWRACKKGGGLKATQVAEQQWKHKKTIQKRIFPSKTRKKRENAHRMQENDFFWNLHWWDFIRHTMSTSLHWEKKVFDFLEKSQVQPLSSKRRTA